MTRVRGHDIIAIGGSAGGLPAIKELLARLPAPPVTLFAVLHAPAGTAQHFRCLVGHGGRKAGARAYMSRVHEASAHAQVLRELLTRVAAIPHEEQLG